MPETTVKSVDTFLIELPYKPRPAKYMRDAWAVNFRPRIPLCRVELANGVIGYGEGRALPEGIAKVRVQNPADFLRDDSIGRGLQMALYDAVGKTWGVPAHRLMGKQYRDDVLMAWSAYPMPAQDWKEECREAMELGYMHFRGKARPWFDVREQCAALRSVAPSGMQFGLDFNSMLMSYDRARPLLQELEAQHDYYLFEEPLPPGDLKRNRRLCSAIETPLFQHWGAARSEEALLDGYCDGFVLGGRPCQLLKAGGTLAKADKPFYLQVAGTSIAAAFCAHVAAVLTHATLPAICHNHLFARDIVKNAPQVENGLIAVPHGPGLGIEIDQDALEDLRVDDDKASEAPSEKCLFALHTPSHPVRYYGDMRQCGMDFILGRVPVFDREIRIEEVEDDGSQEWSQLQKRACQVP